MHPTFGLRKALSFLLSHRNSKSNPEKADEILASVRKTLRDSRFKFEDNYARIIDGAEEGLSSWVTVNYLHGSLLYTQVWCCGSTLRKSLF